VTASGEKQELGSCGKINKVATEGNVAIEVQKKNKNKVQVKLL
jgi:hypothetical protein